jgi:hypothetical protein
MQHAHSHFQGTSRLSRLLAQRKKYTAEEVLQRLQVDWEDDERTAAVHAVAAHTSLWCSRLSDRLAFDLGRAANRLPSVIYWYRQGVSEKEIGQRLSPFGSDWDGNRALEAASALIAQTLNDGAVPQLVA